jgi:hypothetical protein
VHVNFIIGQLSCLTLENKKLKHIECCTFTIVDYCELQEEPMQVCATTMDELAVSLLFQREVQFATCEEELTLIRAIKTDFECCGLTCAKGNLYISDRGVFVYVYSLSGRKLQQFNIDQPGDRPIIPLYKQYVYQS